MFRQVALITSIFSIATYTVSCGGSDDAGDDGESGGSNGAAGTLNFGGSNSGGSTFGPGTHDGGTVPLTPEEVMQIQTASCAGWTTEGEALPAILDLVVDVSGSMESPAPGSNESKWTITRDALSNAIDALGAQTAVGVLYYPNRDTTESTSPRAVTECVNTGEMVPIDLLGPAGSAQRDLLQQSLMDANTGSGTPTHDAYQHALVNGMQAYSSSASKFMLLITDGQPTFSEGCVGSGLVSEPVNEQPIVDAVGAANTSGIRTFIIGSPGSERNESTLADARPWLSRAAMAGGTALPGCSETGPDYCHMDMTEEPDFAAALEEGLRQIAGQINSCTYAIPPPPMGKVIDLTKVNLIVSSGGSSELVLADDMGGCTEGWQLNDQGQVVLCEATCARVEADGTATVRLLFGCNSNDIPVLK